MPRSLRHRRLTAGVLVPSLATLAAAAGLLAPTSPALADPVAADAVAASAVLGEREAVAQGRRGAVSTPDDVATSVGLDVLRDGGNAVDAAVAAAAALGVTDPLSGGLGGGAQLIRVDGRTGAVRTLDGTPTAPSAIPRRAFLDPATGDPYPHYPDLVTGGVAVGVPGAASTWAEALRRWGSTSLRQALKPAAVLAREGVVVDETLHAQVAAEAERFAVVPATAHVYLRDGEPVAVGERLTNPQLARTYEALRRHRVKTFYRGRTAARVVAAARRPVTTDTTLPVPAGHLKRKDLRRYRAVVGAPLTAAYGDARVHGLAGSSAGGTTVTVGARLLDRLRPGRQDDLGLLHLVAEATAAASADSDALVGDRRFVDVPDATLLSRGYATGRACTISADEAAVKPVGPGDPADPSAACDEPEPDPDPETDPGTEPEAAARSKRPGSVPVTGASDDGAVSVVTADKTGTVVVLTTTLGRTGGSGLVVPGAGFLLGSQVADFSPVWTKADPNRLQPGKRPRTVAAPTIVTEKSGSEQRVVLALGSGGAGSAATTVLQLVVDVLDRLLPLEEAVALPRATQRNTPFVVAEQGFVEEWGTGLESLGHVLDDEVAPEIGAVVGLQVDGKRLTAVAEPDRRGGGSAAVLATD